MHCVTSILYCDDNILRDFTIDAVTKNLDRSDPTLLKKYSEEIRFRHAPSKDIA